MGELVSITETVRDAWQGLPEVVPTADKIRFVQSLLDAGFRRVDVGSFVSPKRVPAMADTGEVLAGLRKPGGVVLTALVANARGLDRLLEAPGVDEVLFPFSLSETFQRRNTKMSREEAFDLVSELTDRAHGAGRTMYVTISMAFGNDEGDPFDPAELRRWIHRLRERDVDRVALADTTAQADPDDVRRVLGAVAPGGDDGSLGVHMHATEATQHDLVAACLEMGCRSFDAALGGLGGCQFAKGAESNVSTLPLARQIVDAGYEVDLPLDRLEELHAAARALAV